jgi:uncharacterized OsmC-like protein
MTNHMTTKASLDRLATAFGARPASALSTTTTRATVGAGFLTKTHEDGVEFTVDMPVAVGGSDAGPTPGVFGRACLSSCIAIGIRMAADRQEVAIDAIKVDLSMDWDGRGLFGLSGISAGPSNISLEIEVESDAAEKDIQTVIAEGMRNDPWLVALMQPHDVTTDIRIAGRP